MRRLLLYLFGDISIPDAAYGFLVCLEHFDVVHVGLPIFNVAAVIASHHPNVIVGPDHASYWAVMCLFNQTNKSRIFPDRNHADLPEE